MKGISAWILSGVLALALLGLAGFLMGLLLPGGWTQSEIGAGGSPTQIAELTKKADALAKQISSLATPGQSKGQDSTMNHRVFVSRTLLFLPSVKEQVQPMQEDLVTSDGIKVGWKIKHGLDLEDPGIADQDEDNDGFSNKEEFDKGTDPADPASSPSRWVKLRVASIDSQNVSISFTGKSNDRFTLRFQVAGKRKEFPVAVGDRLWLAVSGKGIDVFTSETEGKSLVETHACPHLIPITIKDYKADRGSRMNEATKTMTDYDDSYLELQRGDGVPSLSKVLIEQVGIKYEKGKERGLLWSVGDIRLISLVPGEGEMGPYRIGQSFPYAGKVFVLKDATAEKVILRMQPEDEEVVLRPKTP